MNVAAMDRKRTIFMASQRDKLQIALFRENSMFSLLRFCVRTAYGVVRCVWFQQCLYCPWMVVTGRKGHLPEALHLFLVTEVQRIVPDWAEVIVLGDSECDGVALQTAGDAAGWQYVCRPANNTLPWRAGQQQHTRDMPVQPDRLVSWSEVNVTGQQDGPVHAIAFWDAGEAQPCSLLTNLADAAQAVWHYLRRAHSEPRFSDQTSRGVRIDKRHSTDRQRLARLVIAVCPAYIWMIHLGTIARRDGWVVIIHRPDRCDLSLFQLGLRLLHHLLKEDLPIPVGFILLDDAIV